MTMLNYLKNNLTKGYRISPRKEVKTSFALILLFALIALAVGNAGNLFSFQIVDGKTACIALFSLFLFPALLEESFSVVLLSRSIPGKGGNRLSYCSPCSARPCSPSGIPSTP